MRYVRGLARAAASPVTSARVAGWAWRQARRTIAGLPVDGIDALDRVAAAPPVAAHHRGTASAALRLSGATCLVRSAVLQRWDADHDRLRPLVIGVSKSAEEGFAAHAWLEGDSPGGFVELHRRPPPAQG
jgi:hypothetical protein